MNGSQPPKKSSPVFKILAVFVWIFAFLFLVAPIFACSVRSSVGLQPEYGPMCMMGILGALLTWGGLALWKK
jgi:hypothetical protein